MKFVTGLLLGLIILIGKETFGQIEITFPSERAVFQRNNGNATIVYIAGHYRSDVDRIEARFVPISGGNLVGWSPIVTNPNFGTYRGSLVVSGGWYKLEVRGLKNGNVIHTSTINKVGVGEVFVISGQSNAQGYNNYGQKGASDDRVNVIGNYHSFRGDKPSYPTFTKLDAETLIAPTGNGAWCWGELGDKLAKKLNVPILFINTAWEGFEVSQFLTSSYGEAGRNPYSGNIAPKGYPFGSISDALHYYTNLLGLRSILWHQGESDNFLSTSKEQYESNLTAVINQSRGVTGKNVSWVVAKASKDRNRFYQPVIEAQTSVIQNSGNVFEGPNTDNISNRWDGVHFSSAGLSELAEAWNQKLDGNFFAYSNPQIGNPPLFINIFCDPSQNSNAPLRIAAPQGYSSYEWSNGANSDFTWLGQGRHQGMAKDRFGNVYYSAPLVYNSDLVPNKPIVTASGPTEFCAGNSVELTANRDEQIYWNINKSGPKIKAENPGNYTATYINLYSCGATSNPIEIKNYPTPQPKVTPSGPTEICSDQELTLNVDATSSISWNNGSDASSIKVSESGEYYAMASNEFGCIGKSNTIPVTIKPAAIKPNVTNMGPSEFCETDSTVLVADNFEEIQWNTGLSQSRLIIKEGGTFFAINKNEFGCKSESEKYAIKVNPNPTKPKITSEGSTVFCDNKTITIKGPEAVDYEWSTGDTSREVSLNQSSEVYLRVSNEFGCLSPISDGLEVIALSTPKNPSVIQTGTFTLSGYFSGDTTDINYIWKYNSEEINLSKQSIKAKLQGSYSVSAYKEFTTLNGENITCYSEESPQMQYFLSENNKGFSVYPNPIDGNALKIETLEDIDNATVTVYDLVGKKYLSFFVPIFDGVKEFDVKNIPNGQYLIKIKNNRSKFTSKLIVR